MYDDYYLQKVFFLFFFLLLRLLFLPSPHSSVLMEWNLVSLLIQNNATL
jgi:hypothetical protein